MLIAAQHRMQAEFAQWADQAWRGDFLALFRPHPEQLAAFRAGERAGAMRLDPLVASREWHANTVTSDDPAKLSIAWLVGHREGRKMAKQTGEEYDATRVRVAQLLADIRHRAAAGQ